ncbi:MAG: phosphomannomutase/phosphoglucomutase [Myxococcales bacterium]|nr:phosphomannomutase/phosphoglucomutase [Myxococcales bacterium]
MNPHIFRAYDIRGVADRDLGDDVARAIGRATGLLTLQRGVAPVLAVGRDARLSSPRLRDALVEGLTSVGVHVVDVGVCATPMLYFAAHTFDVGGGVMVTGSHNPAGDNGFKIVLDKASLHGDDIQLLGQMARGNGASPEADANASPGAVLHADVHTPYTAWLCEHLELGPRKLKVVVDAGNGPTGPVAPGILRRLGCEVWELFTDLDGRFPNHHPDPTVAANLVDLQRKVAEVGADVGIAYDGDGDRIGVTDEQGGILWGDRLMVILARDVLRVEPGAAIVGEVKCSQTLFDDIARHGGRPIMSRVGHSLIKDRMKQEGALLGGEMSGHIFYKHRYFGYDDAMYATGRLLEVLSREARPLSALLVDLPPTFATPEVRVHCDDDIKFAVVDAVTRHFKTLHTVIDIDGARVVFPDGWGLVRASNTGPVLVLRCEAASAEACERIRLELTRAIEAAHGGPVGAAAH